MEKPRKSIAVVMQRRSVRSRWQSEVWEPVGVLCEHDGDAAPRVLVASAPVSQWLHPGQELTLHRDEAEGYFHNVASEAPMVFVRWRMEEGAGVPELVTLSYDEASRWMDGGAQVDPVPMTPELFAWVGAFVEEHYRPGPKKRIKPQSFKSPKDRAKV